MPVKDDDEIKYLNVESLRSNEQVKMGEKILEASKKR